MIEIPKGTYDAPAPCWIPCTDSGNNRLKPLIKCKCGRVTGIGLHHVHADGKVTASFFHKQGDEPPADPKGCGWHVFLKLKDYDQGEFLPEDAK